MGAVPINTLRLKENDYIFDDETGDLTIPNSISRLIDSDCDYVEVEFIEEENQTHFPKFKVHRGYKATRLEYIG